MWYVNQNGQRVKEFAELSIELKIVRVKYEMWNMFKKHHYLSADLNKSARCFCAYWNDEPIAFCAVLPQPSGQFKNGWRCSRLVTLPEYQGLGIGSKLLQYVAELVKGIEGESHFFIRMMQPGLAHYCLNHEGWEETSHSRKKQDKTHGFTNYKLDTRLCYAFKYEGKGNFKDSHLFYTSFSKSKKKAPK